MERDRRIPETMSDLFPKPWRVVNRRRAAIPNVAVFAANDEVVFDLHFFTKSDYSHSYTAADKRREDECFKVCEEIVENANRASGLRSI